MAGNNIPHHTKQEIIKLIQEISKKLGRTPTFYDFIARSKVGERQCRRHGGYLKLCREAGVAKPTADNTAELKYKLEELQQVNQTLRADLADAEKQALSHSKITDILGLTKDKVGQDVPEWLKPAKTYKGALGIANLFLSDIHFDEVVKPEQIQYSNAYNREIAVKRLRWTFQSAIDLLKGCFANPRYEGFGLHLGGDLLSGNIHEELAETNEDSTARSLLLLTDLLIEFIEAAKDEFGMVFVTGVVGNHGRMHHKPRMKNRVYDNFEWLIYQYLIRHFKDDSKVSFLVPDGPDALFQIYNTKFLLTHGDQFHGGTGISGLMAPLMLGMHRKQKRQNQIQKPFDIMMMGHWHQYHHTDSFIVNGSVKGYDEFAHQLNLPFERPQQALFIVHPENGVTFRCPVLCDAYEQKRVSAPKGKIIF